MLKQVARMENMIAFVLRSADQMDSMVRMDYEHYHTKQLHKAFHVLEKNDAVMAGAGGWPLHAALRTPSPLLSKALYTYIYDMYTHTPMVARLLAWGLTYKSQRFTYRVRAIM